MLYLYALISLMKDNASGQLARITRLNIGGEAVTRAVSLTCCLIGYRRTGSSLETRRFMWAPLFSMASTLNVAC